MSVRFLLWIVCDKFIKISEDLERSLPTCSAWVRIRETSRDPVWSVEICTMWLLVLASAVWGRSLTVLWCKANGNWFVSPFNLDWKCYSLWSIAAFISYCIYCSYIFRVRWLSWWFFFLLFDKKSNWKSLWQSFLSGQLPNCAEYFTFPYQRLDLQCSHWSQWNFMMILRDAESGFSFLKHVPVVMLTCKLQLWDGIGYHRGLSFIALPCLGR